VVVVGAAVAVAMVDVLQNKKGVEIFNPFFII